MALALKKSSADGFVSSAHCKRRLGEIRRKKATGDAGRRKVEVRLMARQAVEVKK